MTGGRQGGAGSWASLFGGAGSGASLFGGAGFGRPAVRPRGAR